MKPIVCSVANGFWICLDFICFPGNKLLLLGWPSYLSNSGDVWNTWHQHVRPPKVYSDFVIYVICILGISGNLCSISFTCHHFPIYICIYIYSCSIYLHVSHKCCISSHTSPRYQCPSSFGLACCIHQEWKGCYFKCWNLISTWVGERKFPRFASWKFVHWQSHVKNVVGAKEFPTNSVSQR